MNFLDFVQLLLVLVGVFCGTLLLAIGLSWKILDRLLDPLVKWWVYEQR